VNERTHYRLLAELFEYPTADLPQTARAVAAAAADRYPDAAATLDRFRELLPAADLTAMQELFIRSFDVQAVTTLDVGYVLFGDDYKRGQLLAHLNREHNDLGNDCGKELPDHLPNLLRLIAKHTDAALVEELVREIVAPAVRSMIGEFSAERMARKDESYKKHYRTLLDTPPVGREGVTLYRLALTALYAVLVRDFALVESEQPKAASDFLASLRRENEIEGEAAASN
jgi:nitrate reductase molybdenum cofactor assembly chaperone